jgi:hypothetical protein
MEVTDSQIEAYLAGDAEATEEIAQRLKDLRKAVLGRADSVTARRVVTGLGNPQSLESRYVDRMILMAETAMDPDTIAWGRLLERGSEAKKPCRRTRLTDSDRGPQKRTIDAEGQRGDRSEDGTT